MKTSDNYLYDRNIELQNLLWAQKQIATDLRQELLSLLSSLQDIRKLNSLGKTKQIADTISSILARNNYE